MHAFLLHKDRRPPLRKGELILPIAAWQFVATPLHVLREANRRSRVGRCDYLTLLKLPEDQPVAVVIGEISFKKSELRYYPLNALPAEDRELLDDSFRRLNEGLSTISLSWIARLVLGGTLARSAVKWTKDLRLLERGTDNAATKRR